MKPVETIEEQAFRKLYKKAYGFICKRARLILQEEEGALEVTQETFMRAWSRWARISEVKSPVGWLLVTVTRLCLRRLRRLRVMREQSALALATGLRMEETSHGARLLLLRLQKEKLLLQRVVIHVWLDGMRQEEVAVRLGISRKTVQRQLEAFRSKHSAELVLLGEIGND